MLRGSMGRATAMTLATSVPLGQNKEKRVTCRAWNKVDGEISSCISEPRGLKSKVGDEEEERGGQSCQILSKTGYGILGPSAK